MFSVMPISAWLVECSKSKLKFISHIMLFKKIIGPVKHYFF